METGFCMKYFYRELNGCSRSLLVT